jgi:hypothetical protein
MTNGIKSLRQIQLSRETSQGSPTTDFEVWRGEGTIEDKREIVFPAEDVGIFGGTTRSYCPLALTELVLGESPATFEQLYHTFDSGIYKATPTTDASSAKIRTYTLPLTQATLKSSSDLQTYSVKAGDNNEVEKSAFMFTTEFEISGSAGEALNITSTMTGRELFSDTAGFDASADIPTSETVLFGLGKLYIDSSSDGFGVTQVSNTLLSFNLKVTGLWIAQPTGDGRIDYSLVKMVMPEITDEITFEHNGSASTEKAAFKNQTTRLIQVKFEGSALSDTDAGATYDKKTLIFNLPGRWESFGKLDEMDGNDVVTGTQRVRYDPDSAKFAAIILVSEVA